MSVTRSHSLSIGLVGLPNAGKSTLFNAITNNAVPAENYPFCTIDKNVGNVAVPDPRLEKLEAFFNAVKKVPAAIAFTDIAGLVKGASQGEGLGNQFLSHIREVDVIIYVLRTFQNSKIIHVYDRINPLDDLQIVQTELILKDAETVANKLNDLKRKARSGPDKELQMQINVLERLTAWLEDVKMAIAMEMTAEESNFVKELFLLTFKKQIYLLNIEEGLDQEMRDKIEKEFVEYTGEPEFVIQVDIKLLSEVNEMSSEEKQEYFAMYDKKPVLLDDVVAKAFQRLDLITFYTGSEKEVNAWSIGRGATAKEAAGVIHTDLAAGFVTADVVNVEKLIEAGGMVKAKEQGLVRVQGKEYEVQDGDYIIINSTK